MLSNHLYLHTWACLCAIKVLQQETKACQTAEYGQQHLEEELLILKQENFALSARVSHISSIPWLVIVIFYVNYLIDKYMATILKFLAWHREQNNQSAPIKNVMTLYIELLNKISTCLKSKGRYCFFLSFRCLYACLHVFLLLLFTQCCHNISNFIFLQMQISVMQVILPTMLCYFLYRLFIVLNLHMLSLFWVSDPVTTFRLKTFIQCWCLVGEKGLFT